MKIDFGHGEKEVEATLYTLALYEQEFQGADLIGEYFGEQVIRKSDYEEEDGDIILRVNFADAKLTKATKVLWAILKTADPTVPSYIEWSKGMREVDLLALHNSLQGEIGDAFFSARTSASKEEE